MSNFERLESSLKAQMERRSHDQEDLSCITEESTDSIIQPAYAQRFSLLSHSKRNSNQYISRQSTPTSSVTSPVNSVRHSPSNLNVNRYVATKHSCICGAKLVLVNDEKLYDGEIACCDICQREIALPETFYHCDQNNSHHVHGYDVCTNCVFAESKGKTFEEKQSEQPKRRRKSKRISSSNSMSMDKQMQRIVHKRLSRDSFHEEHNINDSKYARRKSRKHKKKQYQYVDNYENQSEQSFNHAKHNKSVKKMISSKFKEIIDGRKPNENPDMYELRVEKSKLRKETEKQQERIKHLERQLQVALKGKIEKDTTLKAVKSQVQQLILKNDEVTVALNKQIETNVKLQPSAQMNLLYSLQDTIAKLNKKQKKSDKELSHTKKKIVKMEEMMSNMYQVFSGKFEKSLETIHMLEKQLKRSSKESNIMEMKDVEKDQNNELLDNAQDIDMDAFDGMVESIQQELDLLQNRPLDKHTEDDALNELMNISSNE